MHESKENVEKDAEAHLPVHLKIRCRTVDVDRDAEASILITALGAVQALEGFLALLQISQVVCVSTPLVLRLQ